jgi:NAD(P)-dependent dehydrogenase (short-subunit alcohol dehydrogenase family)
MNLELTDKTALISGSTKGIGFAIAGQLAAEGARVIVNGRSDPAVSSAVDQIQKAVPGAKVEGFAGDLATAAATDDLLKLFPAVDILINNLGIYEPKPFDKISDEDWRHIFEVNVLSGVRLSRAYTSGMKQRNWGRIIFISSESGISTPKEMIHYGMTKTAQMAVSRGLAEDCGGTGVTVNSILPGPTRSAGLEDFVGQLGGGSLPIFLNPRGLGFARGDRAPGPRRRPAREQCRFWADRAIRLASFCPSCSNRCLSTRASGHVRTGHPLVGRHF